MFLLEFIFFFFFFSSRNFRAPLADQLHAQSCIRLYNPGLKFWGSLPKKILGAKTCKIWPDFGRLQSSAVNISGRDEDIQNQTNTLCFQKTGTLFISFIIHSNDDQFTRNFYQM